MLNFFMATLAVGTWTPANLFLKSLDTLGDNAPITYTIERVVTQDQETSLKITLLLTGEPDGTTILSLPGEWAGQEGFEKGIENLKVLTLDSSIKYLSATSVEITHPPRKPIVIDYTLKRKWQGPINRDGFYWPQLQTEYIHFFGLATLIVPEWDGKKEREIHMQWKGFPASWNLINSHGLSSDGQHLRVGLNSFLHAIFLAGDFRIVPFEIHGAPIYFALRGQWKFPESELIDLAEKIVTSQREFFRDFDYPFYLISLIPTDSPCCMRGGTGLTQSFAMHASKDLPKSFPFRHLLAHELFHNWNGRKIKRREPEELVYWFSEGFTEYFSRRINLQAGIIDLPEYLKQVNENIVSYSFSPEKNAPNQKILEEFWTNPDISYLPYLRGELIGHYWNTQIKQRNPQTSLDDFIRDLFQAAVTQGAVVEPQTIADLMLPYLPGGVQTDLSELVDRGDTVPLLQESMGPCISLKDKMIPAFEMGFDVEGSFEKGMIIDLKDHSNAFQAGLRNGMKLIRIRNQNGNPFFEATVIVEIDGELKEFKYFPAGALTAIPQFFLNSDLFLQDPEKCMSWFRSFGL